MHKIDAPDATSENEFTEGDMLNGVAATTITADWLNAVQTELVNAIGVSNKDDNAQLATILNVITNNIEEITERAMRKDDVGRLNLRSCNVSGLKNIAQNEIYANGQLLDRNAYPELWKYALGSGRLVEEKDWNSPAGKLNFSRGNGTTTFRLAQLTPSDLVK